MTEGLVLAATAWPSNADLIADVARLGYLKPGDLILDPTFGLGTWWKRWRPETLVWLSAERDGVDFRRLPYVDDYFDAVAFDPPYVCLGGRRTSTLAYGDRYGLAEAPPTPQGLQALMNDGLTECARVLKPGGVLLMKCADYVSSGRLWPGTHHSLTHAFSLRLDLVDRFEHVGNPRPQSQRRQVHARRNLSTLFVFRKPRRTREAPHEGTEREAEARQAA